MTTSFRSPRPRQLSPWVWELKASQVDPEATLIMLPHAGGSASAFADWASHTRDSVRVLAIQYPGRGARYRDPQPVSVLDLANAIAAELRALDLTSHTFVGHSMGAILAYEVVVNLEAAGESPSRMVGGTSSSCCATGA